VSGRSPWHERWVLNDHDVKLALDTMVGLIGDTQVMYLVAPLNGGPRLMDYVLDRETVGTAEEVDRFVVRPNRADAQRGAARLRLATGRPVFDPTCFGVYKGWNQRDYVDLCLQIIASKADSVVFADGWQFSSGCIEEYEVVVASGLPMFDFALRQLDPEVGWQMVAEAVECAAERGWDLRQGRPARSGDTSRLYPPCGHTTAAIACSRCKTRPGALPSTHIASSTR
jgi:hypothetical protein